MVLEKVGRCCNDDNGTQDGDATPPSVGKALNEGGEPGYQGMRVKGGCNPAFDGFVFVGAGRSLGAIAAGCAIRRDVNGLYDIQEPWAPRQARGPAGAESGEDRPDRKRVKMSLNSSGFSMCGQ